MTGIVERFSVIWETERLEAKWLKEMTGVKADRWYTITRSGDMRASEIEMVNQLFPEYKVWLSTGEEYPEAGQISPMTKKAQKTLKNQPKAG